MRNRSIARECALKILYQAEIARRDIPTAADYYWKDNPSSNAEMHTFAQRIVAAVSEHSAAIDEKITQYATNWQLKRMAIIDRNILRVGVCELLYASDVPPKVTINEAVELAKKYGDLDSSKFVNGILDKLHKSEIVPHSNPDDKKV